MKKYSQEDYIVLTAFFVFVAVATGFAVLPAGKMWAILGFTVVFALAAGLAFLTHGLVLGVYWFIARTLRWVVSKVSQKI